MLESMINVFDSGSPLLDSYRPPAGAFDELRGGDGSLRPHWRYLISAMEALGLPQLSERAEDVRRQLYENGVTYNVYGQALGAARLWPLDPLPMLVTSAEWSRIEQGLIQRAELLNLVLADIYGAGRLMRDGLLPYDLILAHPGFLRPCQGALAQRAQPLCLYAADLGRAADGEMRVIGDRTQAPSGAGYALENRIVLSRVFPSLYRDSHVHRLALFFRNLRQALQRLAQKDQANPHIAVLTSGSASETYFEHAYLADYLGYTLVEGRDLTVRNGRVWLRSLDGLKPVDVLLRRIDDVYCDPLELRSDSLIGTPGLLEVARSGSVGLANPLGSAVLDHPGLMSFLPQLCRELLGEDLKLASAQTWWCGDAESLAYVEAHIHELVIKPIHPHAAAFTAFGATLSAAERSDWLARVRARPHLYVAQEQLGLSVAPVLAETALEPRHIVLRTFLAASDDGGYAVMPGGLVRVAPSRDSWLVSNHIGGVSKDLWVLASEPERQVSLVAGDDSVAALVRGDDSIPARVADDLFWLGRYASRVEAGARLLREILLRMTSTERGAGDDGLLAVLRAVGAQTRTFPGGLRNLLGPSGQPPARGKPAEPVAEDATELSETNPIADRTSDWEKEVLGLISDGRRFGSLRFNVAALLRTSGGVRDRLSNDASRILRSLDRALSSSADPSSALQSLQRVILQLSAFAGICHESMTRGPAWRFLELGRRLEYATQMTALLRSLFLSGLVVDNRMPWEVLLAAAHSVKTFRRRYRSRMEPAAILDLLLLDTGNPRSLIFQLERVEQLVRTLGGDAEGHRTPDTRLALDAVTRLRLFDAEAFRALGPAEAAALLEPLLANTDAMLARISEEITRRYFQVGDAPQQLVRWT